MPTLYTLPEEDIEVLREIVAQVRRQRGGTPVRQVYDLDDSPAPDIYLAKVPPSGIDAATEPGTGSGTAYPDYPKTAVCQVYKVSQQEANPKLVEVEGLTRAVHNIHPSSITGDTWIVTARDKFGTWVVVNATGGATNWGYTSDTEAGVISLENQVVGDGIKSFQDATRHLTGTSGTYSDQVTTRESATSTTDVLSIYQGSTKTSSVTHGHTSGASGETYFIVEDIEHGGYFSINTGGVSPVLTLFSGGLATLTSALTNTLSTLSVTITGVGSAFLVVQDPNSYISLDGNTGVSATTGGITFYGGIYTGGTLSVSSGSVSGFDEAAQDAVGTILTDTDTINLTYTDATPSITADVRYQMSITSDPSGLKLSGDSTTPGNTKYYGTDSSGTKGWYTLTIGTGDVVGPAVVTDNMLARYDGTTGKIIQGSTIIVDDSGNLSGANTLSAVLADAGTSAATVVTLGHNTSDTPAAGFGSIIKLQLKSSTTADTEAADLTTTWATATHATRKARVVLNVRDTAARECLRLEASGVAPMIGFLGSSAAAQQTADVATALETYGLMSLASYAGTRVGEFVAAGGSAAKGAVPSPGATAYTNHPWLLGTQAGFVVPSGKLLDFNLTTTDESRSATTFADLATVDELTFTLDVDGEVTFIFLGNFYNDTANAGAGHQLEFDGTDDTATATIYTYPTANQGHVAGYMYTKTLTAGSRAVRMQYRAVVSGTAHFRQRCFLAILKS